MKISSESYVNSFGSICPNCQSRDIVADIFEAEGNYRNVQCDDCDASWIETYEMTGYENLADTYGEEINE